MNASTPNVGGVMASTNVGGLSGAFIPVSEDEGMIAAAEKAFGATMKIPAHMEEAAFGAALFGMVATGEMGTVEEIKQIIRYQEA